MKTEKIYTKLKKRKEETVADFMIRVFIDEGQLPYDMAVSTYHDINCTKIQCTSGKNRSLHDLYSIALSKYPRLTYKTFCKALIGILKRKGWRIILCMDITDWVVQKCEPGRKFAQYRIGGYRMSYNKIHHSGTEGYDAYTFLINAGVDMEKYPATKDQFDSMYDA